MAIDDVILAIGVLPNLELPLSGSVVKLDAFERSAPLHPCFGDVVLELKPLWVNANVPDIHQGNPVLQSGRNDSEPFRPHRQDAFDDVFAGELLKVAARHGHNFFMQHQTVVWVGQADQLVVRNGAGAQLILVRNKEWSQLVSRGANQLGRQLLNLKRVLLRLQLPLKLIKHRAVALCQLSQPVVIQASDCLRGHVDFRRVRRADEYFLCCVPVNV